LPGAGGDLDEGLLGDEAQGTWHTFCIGLGTEELRVLPHPSGKPLRKTVAPPPGPGKTVAPSPRALACAAHSTAKTQRPRADAILLTQRSQQPKVQPAPPQPREIDGIQRPDPPANPTTRRFANVIVAG
jgi:hypothetical protein